MWFHRPDDSAGIPTETIRAEVVDAILRDEALIREAVAGWVGAQWNRDLRRLWRALGCNGG